MDKKKQIEGISKVIRPILENRIDIGFIPDLDKPIAEEIYNAGYRKIPDGSVVLTKEKYMELTLAKQSIFKMLDEIDTKARKETAREILSLLYTAIPKTQIVVEIKKRYGVEVEE